MKICGNYLQSMDNLFQKEFFKKEWSFKRNDKKGLEGIKKSCFQAKVLECVQIQTFLEIFTLMGKYELEIIF